MPPVVFENCITYIIVIVLRSNKKVETVNSAEIVKSILIMSSEKKCVEKGRDKGNV